MVPANSALISRQMQLVFDSAMAVSAPSAGACERSEAGRDVRRVGIGSPPTTASMAISFRCYPIGVTTFQRRAV
ncbi:hypothetical protein Cs7R123_56950 [Catellatospora sp. TT07R-123]|nr:hypothetical protein Cs7R123_56950 [Catellatospora sp. TT07R-123]